MKNQKGKGRGGYLTRIIIYNFAKFIIDPKVSVAHVVARTNTSDKVRLMGICPGKLLAAITEYRLG